jgi:carbon-monoxide dehydrogenase large subunit
VTFEDGVAHGPGRRTLALADIAAAAGPLSANGTFANTKRTYSYGAHAAHVTVDPRTGRVEVLDYVAVEDVGRAINPALVHGQTFGAVVQGLGGVFLDHIIYDADAQLLNASLADYLLPTASDFPNIRGVTMELHRSPSNPLGAKGAGEGGMVAVAATAGNAVAAALATLKVAPNELPLSPPRLWRLIQQVSERRHVSRSTT